MKKLILIFLISGISNPLWADMKSEVQEIASQTTPLHVQEQNDWVQKGLNAAMKKANRNIEAIQFDSWNTCGLGVETVWAYVKLDDGRKCQVSVRAGGGLASITNVGGVFECYAGNRAVPGYDYSFDVGSGDTFKNVKVEKSSSAAFVCF